MAAILSGAIAALTLAVAAPTDIDRLAADIEACIHFAGEEPYDAERAAFLKKNVENSCGAARNDLPRLRARYAGDAGALARIEALQVQLDEAIGPEN